MTKSFVLNQSVEAKARIRGRTARLISQRRHLQRRVKYGKRQGERYASVRSNAVRLGFAASTASLDRLLLTPGCDLLLPKLVKGMILASEPRREPGECWMNAPRTVVLAGLTPANIAGYCRKSADWIPPLQGRRIAEWE
jgi:hypothetical protein